MPVEVPVNGAGEVVDGTYFVCGVEPSGLVAVLIGSCVCTVMGGIVWFLAQVSDANSGNTFLAIGD